jgi:hypothetical protein
MPVPILDDIISYGKVAWGVVSYLWRCARRNRHNLTPQQKLELLAKWKPPVESWKELMNTQTPRKEEGFLLGFESVSSILMKKASWSDYELKVLSRNRAAGDWAITKARNMVLTGFIPYENIEMIDWDGDDYYPYPHIYCYFDLKSKPYERLAYCEKGTINEHIYLLQGNR